MSKKVIVTHIFPDLDAIGAAWLLVRFDPDFSETGFSFVPAGETLNHEAADSDPTIVHVDTGMGRFDHHQLGLKTSAAELVFKDLSQRYLIDTRHLAAVERLIKLITAIDNFEECYWPEAAADRYDLSLSEIINNLKISGKLNDTELVYQGMILLDAALTGFLIKCKVEEEVRVGKKFNSVWGRSLAVESKHSLLSKLAQKMGFDLVIRKEPKTGFVSIKSRPRLTVDLAPLYEKLRRADPKASWFFHQSRHIIVNGSRHNPEVKASNLSLEEIIKEVESCGNHR